MNKISYFLIFLILLSSCSFNKNSKFRTSSQNIIKENNPNYKELFVEEEALSKELNSNLKIKLINKVNIDKYAQNYFNNDGRLKYDGELKKA